MKRLIGVLLAAGAIQAAAQEQVWIPMKTSGLFSGEKTIKLEATLYRPKGEGPFPLLLFSHGSTGGGRIADTLTLRPDTVAAVFLARGFVVLAPMRRGRGASEGNSDEPISCDNGMNFWAMGNAVADTDAALAYARTLPSVDASRLVLSGASRGGILSVYYASQRPGVARAVVNFVGGWTGDSCIGDFNSTAYGKAASAKIPTLWLYAENDRYYSANSIRRYASVYEQMGGLVTLRLYPPVGSDGHYLTRYPDVWRKDLEAFLDTLGFNP